MSTIRPVPARCLVLGLDPGATSGWCSMRPAPGGLVRTALDASGTCTRASERAAVVRSAVDRAAALGLPIVCVAEEWATQGMTPKTFGGLSRAWGNWQEHLEIAEVPIVRVFPHVWRGALGLRARGSTEWKQAAKLAVRARYGVDVGSDESEAICIATFGAFSTAVAAELARR